MDQPHQNGKDSISDSQNASGAAREKLMAGLKNAIGEAEHYLEQAGEQIGAATSDLRAGFDDQLRTAKDDLRKLEENVVARGRQAARSTDAYVQENPWQAVTVGATVGLLLGLLISRR